MDKKIAAQPDIMRAFYRRQAAIYDATRWAFLFGREAILAGLPVNDSADQLLLEVGCGTGHNLRLLARRHPGLHLAGVDVSADMLYKASKNLSGYSQRVQLFDNDWGGAPLPLFRPPDFVLFSYSLTMFNPGWQEAVRRARRELPAGGRIAVVDFHDTGSGAFRWWMDRHRVRMDGHLLPFLESEFKTERLEIRPAWLGLWRYFMFVGLKD